VARMQLLLLLLESRRKYAQSTAICIRISLGDEDMVGTRYSGRGHITRQEEEEEGVQQNRDTHAVVVWVSGGCHTCRTTASSSLPSTGMLHVAFVSSFVYLPHTSCPTGGGRGCDDRLEKSETVRQRISSF
jgi:hypothetical protein